MLIHSLFVIRHTPSFGSILCSDNEMSRFPLSDVSFIKEPFLGPGKQPAPSPKRNLSLDEFFQRMSIREDVPLETAREHAHAVMSVLVDALSKGEFEDIRAQLPIEFYYEFFEGK